MDKLDNLFENMGNGSVRLILSPGPAAREAFLYAQEVGYLEVDSSYQVELDNLDSFLILFVCKGSGKLVYGSSEYQLENSSLFFIDCQKYHKYHASEQGWNVLYLYFNGKQARGNYNIISNETLPIFKVDNSKVITSLLWQIISLHSKNSRYVEQLTSLHITRIITEISMFSNNAAVMEVDYPLFIHYVFHHISLHYDEKISLDMLAKLYSVSKFHLAREFKRYSGMTINEYIITTRINKAKALLRYSEKTIDQIAAEVGFYSSSHFIKLFRNREHITPLFYKKQWTRLSTI